MEVIFFNWARSLVKIIGTNSRFATTPASKIRERSFTTLSSTSVPEYIEIGCALLKKKNCLNVPVPQRRWLRPDNFLCCITVKNGKYLVFKDNLVPRAFLRRGRAEKSPGNEVDRCFEEWLQGTSNGRSSVSFGLIDGRISIHFSVNVINI